MKNNRKALLLLLCAVLMVSASVFGTLAYLTDTDDVTNTFSVGQVGLKLDEAKVNKEGKPVDENGNVLNEVKDAPRVDGNEYHLLPGHTYVKDPTVTVDAKSEESYVRMIVTVKNIDQLKAAMPKCDDKGKEIEANKKYYAGDLFLLQMLCNGWNPEVWGYVENSYKETQETTQVDGKEVTTKYGAYEFRFVGNKKDAETNELLKDGIVAKADTPTKLPALFQSITVPGEIDNTHLAHLADVEIKVTAHAIQADGFKDANAAWAVFTTPAANS